jgi:hypothetical protein
VRGQPVRPARVDRQLAHWAGSRSCGAIFLVAGCSACWLPPSGQRRTPLLRCQGC